MAVKSQRIARTGVLGLLLAAESRRGSRSTVQRALVRAILGALVVVVIGPVGIAMAEAPNVTITSPLNESVSSNPTPSFSGTTDDSLDEVTLKIYAGPTVKEEALAQTLTTFPLGAAWSAGPAVTLADGEYTAQATQTNSEGPGTSSPVTFTVNPPPCSASPTIEEQPKDQTVTAPATATFKAAGSTPLNCAAPTVQWSSEAPGETSFSPIGGATSPSYTTPATTTAESGTKFEAVFTNAFGETTTNEVTLTVEPPPCSASPAIEKQPVGESVTAPGEASFTVKEGTVPANCSAASIQWQVSTDHGSTWSNVSGANISGATSATLEINPTSTSETGHEYRAVLTNAHGPTNSTAATLTVEPPPCAVAPAIEEQPKAQIVTAPASASFKAKGSTPANCEAPTVQWSSKSPGASSFSPILGAKSATYTTPATSTTESGTEFEATFKNAFGETTTNEVTLTVEPPPCVTDPAITEQPKDQSVTAPGEASFSVTEGAVPANCSTATIQWQVSTNKGVSWSNVSGVNISGATSATLQINPTSTSESKNEYRAVLTNAAGSTKSSAATLTVNPPPCVTDPAITEQPVDRSVTEPGAATFKAAASTPEHCAAPSVQWYSEAPGAGVFSAIGGATSVSYKTPATTTAESGTKFEAIFKNAAGETTSHEATLTVNPPPCSAVPSIEKQPVSQTVTAPAAATFTVTEGAVPANCSAATIQWQVSTNKGGTWSNVSGSNISGATSTTLSINPTSTSESKNEYRAVLTNAAGSAKSSAATLTVNPPPPTVTSIEPSSGPTAGSTAVTIKGKDFLKGATVTIGSAASEVKIVSEEEITAKTAPGSGAQKVVVTDEGGTSTLGPSYTYVPPPVVTLNQPTSPSKNTTPSFTGTASDSTLITVKIYAGATVKGSVVSTATATGTGGSWSSGNASPALEDGQYTATATQEGLVGNPAGVSLPVTFTVDTKPPTVTLAGPPSPSKNTTPSFSGTASEAGEVIVRIYEGSKPEGTEVAKATTTVAGGTWSVGATLPPGHHTYTAVAKEVSGLGNAEGKSDPATFIINTQPPTVTLNQPPTPSKNTTPTFSGGASEDGEVVVHIFKGSEPVATAKGTSSGGSWSSGSLSKALPSGRHSLTAFATEESALGNEEGQSATVIFEVNTESPTVSLEQPASPSNETSPTFVGGASEEGEVVVHIFKGSEQVATATGQAGGGAWSSGKATPGLSPGKHTFTAYATEVSSLGNHEGRSNTVTFEVNTEAPVVTLVGPPALSKNTTPSFSGTASEAGEVVVHIFEGSTEKAQATTTASGGKWSTSTLSAALPTGKRTFTAHATEASGLGNGEGESNTVTFEVNTEPPVVTIGQPQTPSKNTTPSFSGTASEATEVVVHVFEGATEVASAKTTASGGTWSTSPLSKALASGKRTFTARATEVSGLGNKAGESGTVSFEVNTNAPTVTINQPPTPSKNTTPSFGGEASENTEVVVRVFEGSTEVDSGSTTASGGAWSATLSKPLTVGKRSLTAKATEKSAVGNKDGESTTVSFELNTEPPTVTLVGPPSPSKNTTPSFSGEASENTEVIVHVFEGSTEKAEAKTTESGGKWSTSTLSKALPTGKHTFTAHATEVSGLGNKAGESNTVTFEVNTEPPVVTLVGPPTPSKNQTPSFSGEASENTEVVVHVFEGSTEVANTKTTAPGGKWSTTTLSKALPPGKRTFTAHATEVSGLGNGPGTSNTVSFEVNTEPPEVTLNQPATPSKNTTPSFSGTASENTEVEVHVFEGSTEKANVKTTASAGKWSTSTLSAALPAGTHVFTAHATEVSGLGNAAGESSTVSFEVNTEPPVVTLAQPQTPSNKTTPSFLGTASENTEVEVHVFEGSTEVASAKTTAAGGKWSTSTLSKALPSGKTTFTAFATEKSGLGNAEGKSTPPVSFEVNTLPPTVTLAQLAFRSSETSPTFSGTASDTKNVTVHLYKGSRAEGTPFAALGAQVVAGAWKSAPVTPPLTDGEYTAVATEESSLGNPAGESPPVTFEVNTKAPKVSLNQVPTPSNNTTPNFSGSASESTPVIVHIYEGSTRGGTIIATATASGTGGSWVSSAVSHALKSGRHTFTAVASQTSVIGNNPGESAPVTFVVNTERPDVTLDPVPSPSNDTTPSFTGDSNEPTTVTVEIFAGPKAEGAAVSTTTAPAPEGGAKWKSGDATRALASGEYTAVALQKSAVGNPEGESSPVTFVIDTAAPRVTLNPLPSPSSRATPSFSGTASDHTPITVDIYAGPRAEGEIVSSVTAEANGGEWVSGKLSSALPWSEYTAMAVQPSSIGNPEGKSSPVTFLIEPIPPTVTTEGGIPTRAAATLYASVNPLGGPVSACYFEVGLTTSYGKNIGCGFVSEELKAFPPAATSAVAVFVRVFGLKSLTTYHYRIVAVGEGGTGKGADATFTTLQPLPVEEEGSPGVLPATSALGHTAAGDVAALFAKQLVPGGKAARIGALLKNGFFKQRFKAPEAGMAVIKWYYLPPGAKLAGAKHAKKAAPTPVLVASGSVTFHAAGTAAVKLRLTGAGRRLLGHSKRVRLTATCAFTPVGGAPVVTSGTFQLSR